MRHLKNNLWLVATAVWLAACRPALPTSLPSPLAPAPSSTSAPATGAATAVAPATPEPPTATPAVLKVGYLSTAATSGGALADSVQRVVAELGGEYMAAADPAPEAVRGLAQAGAAVIIVSGPAWEEALQLGTAEFPQAHFIVIPPAGAALASPPAQAVILGGPETRQDQVGFLAGMAAGFVSQNARPVGIGSPLTEAGLKYRNGFVHGVRYTCPRCRIDLVDAVDQTTALDEVVNFARYGSDVFFAADDEISRASLPAVMQRGALVIGSGDDVYVSLFANGAAEHADRVLFSVYLDPLPLLRQALQAYARGEPLLSGTLPLNAANASIILTPYRRDDLSAFEQATISEALTRLADGSLETGVDPLSGAEK